MIKKVVALLVGLAVIAFILSKLDALKVLEILSKADWLLVLAALIVVFAGVLLKGFKWAFLSGLFAQKISILESSRIFSIGFFLSIPTPGRIGDLARALYLRKRMRFGFALSSVIVDRIADLSVLLFAGIISAFVFSLYFGKQVFSITLALVFLAAFFAAVFVFLNRRIARKVLKPFFNAFVPKSLKQKASESFSEFFESLKVYRKNWKNVLSNALLSVVCLLLSVLSFWLLCLSLGVKADLFFVLMAVPIIALADLLPITISGIGVREGLLIYLFSLVGVGAELAFAVSILYFIIGYITVAFAGFVFFLKEPVDLNVFSA